MRSDHQITRSRDHQIPGLATALAAVASLLAIPLAFLLARVIAGLFDGRLTPADAAPWLALLAAIALARGALAWSGDVAASRVAIQLKLSARVRGAAGILAAGPRALDEGRTGAFATTLTAGVDALDAYVARYQVHRVLAGIVPLAVAIAVTVIDPLSGVVLGVTGPLIPLFMWLIGGIARERTAAQWVDLTRLGARFLDAVQGLVTLRAFGRVEAEAGRLHEASDRFRRLTMDVLKVGFLSSLVLELLATLGTAIVAVEVGLRLLYGRVAFAEALAVLLLAPEFYRPLRTLGQSFHAGMAGQEAKKQLAALPEGGERGDTQKAGASFCRLPSAFSLPRLDAPPRIRFDRVSVEYPGGRGRALADVSFEIAPGECLGIAGASGSGKSTLLALLLRFTDASAGRILVDDTPLAALPPDAWRTAVAWAPQRPHLFHGTIRDNLRLGAPHASGAALTRALACSAFDRVVSALPEGLDTPLGEGGAGLSGGEAQRLSLARAYLKDCPILLLDEPTSELDTSTEAAVLEGLAEMRRGRTVLLVSHRAAPLAIADRTIRLASGSLA
ncbi:MAG: thiol reductant ABC exporter subunit CydD [Vicinamibacterales bacterium]